MATRLWMLMGGLMAARAVLAQDDPMSAYYDNTLVCSSTAQQCHIWFKRDGSYRQYLLTPAEGGKFSLLGLEGSFTVAKRDGVYETCLAPRGNGGPMGMRPTECYGLAGHKVGEEWVAAGKVPMTFTLRAGRQVNALSGFLN
ncbi:MAG: hypothetical protein QM718_14605 [Steroidobacteraceae bacterium]